MWLLTDQVPTLGEARGKIVLFRRYVDNAGLNTQSGIALNWNDQGGSEFQASYMEKGVRAGVTFYIQDRYNYSVKDKMKGMEGALLQAKELAESGELRIHFASTAGPNSLHHPYTIAKQMNTWFQNKQFTGNLGWIIFDYGDAMLAESVYQLNFSIEQCKRNYFFTESNKSTTSSVESTKWWVLDLFVSGGVYKLRQ